MKKVILLSSVTFFMVFLGGCDFLTPEDDLNGNNKKEIDKTVDVLDIEKKSGSSSQGNNQEGQQQAQTSPPQAKKEAPIKKTEEKNDPEIDDKNMEYSEKYKKATIVTNYGDIKIEFFNEDSPLTVGNFTRLAEEGFYNKTKFHRVIENFMIQGGDPNSKDDEWSDDGVGGPGYKFKDEINDHKLVRGSLAMANSGPNTNGSQFFIVTADTTAHLDGKHTNFGKVLGGMDVIDEIEKVKVDKKDHPTKDVIIKEIKLR